MSKPTLAVYGIKDRNMAPFPIFVHDHNLCVMQNGRILGYLHLERFSRRKYDNRLDLFIEDLLDSNILDLPVELDEFDIVSVNDFVGNAFISRNGRFHIEANHQQILEARLFAARAYLSQRCGWCGKEIPAWCCPHEIAHIFSCVPFYGSFKENSLLISFDGASSLGNYSAFICRNGVITLVENNWGDLGFASKLFNDNKLSFSMLGIQPHEHCSLPGKLMGYASWGRYDKEIEQWLRDNSFFNC